MKYIKTFESTYKEALQIGNYVIMNYYYDPDDQENSETKTMNKFMKNVGEVVGFTPDAYYTKVKYYNIPKSIKDYFEPNGVRTISNNNFVRLATQKEIDKHLFNKSLNKFNL